jgi:hypothetical protein
MKTNISLLVVALLIGNSNSIELNQIRGKFADEYGPVPIGLAQ